MDTLEELDSVLTDLGFEGSTIFSKPDFADAAIGVATTGNVVYSCSKMIEHLVNKEGMTYEEATDFVYSDTLFALPNMPNPPIVVEIEFDEEGEIK